MEYSKGFEGFKTIPKLKKAQKDDINIVQIIKVKMKQN